MLDPPVTGEIEHGFLAEPGRIEIAIVHEEFVGLSCRFSHHLTVRIDDHGTCHAVMAILDAALGDRYYPGRVLIGASLQRKLVVKHSLFRSFITVLRVDRRRVETEHHHLDALQAEHSKRLRPAPVVADAHPEHAAQHAPRRKAEVAGLEVALLEMLMAALRVEFVVTGEMDLAILADSGAGLVDQYRSVEVMSVSR